MINNVFFVMEKHVEGVEQYEKHLPDLVESIMRPTNPVKEELRRILKKMDQFRSRITKTRVCTFQVSGKITIPANVISKTIISTPFHPESLH